MNNKAGAVAKPGTDWARGAKNKQQINKKATTTAVKPVRPPAATPEADSIYGVVDEVPNAAPATIAVESANSAFSNVAIYHLVKGRHGVKRQPKYLYCQTSQQ